MYPVTNGIYLVPLRHVESRGERSITSTTYKQAKKGERSKKILFLPILSVPSDFFRLLCGRPGHKTPKSRNRRRRGAEQESKKEDDLMASS